MWLFLKVPEHGVFLAARVSVLHHTLFATRKCGTYVCTYIHTYVMHTYAIKKKKKKALMGAFRLPVSRDHTKKESSNQIEKKNN